MGTKILLGLVLCGAAFGQGAWTEHAGAKLNTSVCPADGFGGSVNDLGAPYAYNNRCHYVTEAWGGGIARKKVGSEQLFIIGGGHGDYAGNEIYRINLNVSPVTLTRLNNPSVAVVADYSTTDGAMISDGKMKSHHTYNWLAYRPSTDLIFMWGGSQYSGNGTNSRRGWWINPDTGDSTPITPSTAGGCITPSFAFSMGPDGISLYNPNDDHFYIHTSFGNSFKFNPNTNCYTFLGNVNPQFTAGVRAMIDPQRNRAVFIGDGVAYTGNAAGTGFTDVEGSLGAACNKLKNSAGPGLDYDSINDRYYGFAEYSIDNGSNGGTSLYEINPDTWACTEITMTGGPAQVGVTTGGLWGRFAVFPSIGKIAVYNGFGQSTFTYDYGTAVPTTNNTISITNEGATESNHPVQIGLAFVQGEIASGQSPQAYIAGVGYVPTQNDAKEFHTDGSLKHAVISFLIPTFTTLETYQVYFAPGTVVGNTALTQGQMLAAGYNFGAITSLTNGGTTRTGNAKTMLTAGDYTVWNSGPIATTIRLGDVSMGFNCPAGVASGAGTEASKYDFGMDTDCAFRPLFEATFWAGINKVKVRFIGEVSNTEQLEDVVTTSMTLTAGDTSPVTIHTQSNVTMFMGSRWTKTAWIGTAPSVDSIHHNLVYLASTYAIPNYDPTKAISAAALTASYGTWTNAAKTLYDAGEWQKAMGAAGGRPDIGPYPSWVVKWLYTGDYRMKEESLGNADLAAAWPMHFREGKVGNFLDRALSVSGMGRVLSVSSRPTICILCGYDYSGTTVGHRLVPIGTNSQGGWNPDVAHQPDPYSIPYLLTGEQFYLEQMMFWASWSAAYGNGAATTSQAGRGPTGKEGGLAGFGALQTRGQAWAFRSRAQTAWLVPDAMPEKSYFDLLTIDAVQIWEGQRNVTGTAYVGTTNYNWGVSPGQQIWPAAGIPALHFWEQGDAVYVQHPIEPSVTLKAHSTWEINFVVYALGRAKELGYATNGLLQWVAPSIVNQVIGAGYNPWLMGAYRIPTQSIATGTYFTDWAGIKTGFITAAQNATSFAPVYSGGDCTANGSDCYAYFAMAAQAMVADQAGGSTAWTWVAANVLNRSALDNEPKWAILPRSIVSSSPTGMRGTAKMRGKATKR